MIADFINVTTKRNDAIINRTFSLIDNNTKLKKDEAPILEFFSILYVLRGFPFNSYKKLFLKFIGNDFKYPLVIDFIGIEKLNINNNIIECYKLQMGVDFFLGNFFPKVNFWFSKEKPHYLARFEGGSGPFGDEKVIIELFKYEVINYNN